MLSVVVKNLQKKVSVYPQKIKKLIIKALREEGVKKKGEITVCFTNDALIRRLNARYLKKDTATDVLAFNLPPALRPGRRDKRELYADIIISGDAAIRNAKIFKTTPLDELNLYSIHGLLHLLGYNDHSKKDIKIMREKELKYVLVQESIKHFPIPLRKSLTCLPQAGSHRRRRFSCSTGKHKTLSYTTAKIALGYRRRRFS